VVHDGPPAELPTSAYPILLSTGRMLEHFHTGSMTHRSRVLESLVPESSVDMNPVDAKRLGIRDGDEVSLTSRRGKVRTRARMTDRVPEGHAFMTFHWGDAPANCLTNPATDPQAKIPEFKIASVRATLSALEDQGDGNLFLAALVDNPAGTLAVGDLTAEHRDALAKGNIDVIEAWVGPVNDRLRLWLELRLSQEDFGEGRTTEM
jgi:formylmethanofuran dehydrogenase subunit D